MPVLASSPAISSSLRSCSRSTHQKRQRSEPLSETYQVTLKVKTLLEICHTPVAHGYDAGARKSTTTLGADRLVAGINKKWFWINPHPTRIGKETLRWPWPLDHLAGRIIFPGSHRRLDSEGEVLSLALSIQSNTAWRQ